MSRRPCSKISEKVYKYDKGLPDNIPYPTLKQAKMILDYINRYIKLLEYSKGFTVVNIKQSLYHRKTYLEHFINNNVEISVSISSLNNPIFTDILNIVNNAISRYPRRKPIVFQEVSLTLPKNKASTITWTGNGTFGLRIRTLGENPGKEIITGIILIGSVHGREAVLTLFNEEKSCIRAEDCILYIIPPYVLHIHL